MMMMMMSSQLRLAYSKRLSAMVILTTNSMKNASQMIVNPITLNHHNHVPETGLIVNSTTSSGNMSRASTSIGQ